MSVGLTCHRSAVEWTSAGGFVAWLRQLILAAAGTAQVRAHGDTGGFPRRSAPKLRNVRYFWYIPSAKTRASTAADSRGEPMDSTCHWGKTPSHRAKKKADTRQQFIVPTCASHLYNVRLSLRRRTWTRGRPPGSSPHVQNDLPFAFLPSLFTSEWRPVSRGQINHCTFL